MLGERIASQSEVIRAIVSGYSSCLVGPRTSSTGFGSTAEPTAVGETFILLTPLLHPY